MIAEIKALAKVDEFPYEDSKAISDLLVAYNKGDPFVMLQMMTAIGTLEKYPELIKNWDSLMMKYKSLGLFPKWNVTPI
jgi:hypothetical protein